MRKIDFASKRIYLDGALGSRILAEGFSAVPEINLENPDVIAKIHKSYLEAGSDVIAANTFSANALKCADVQGIVSAALKIARGAADEYGALVAYDCGPLGELVEPLGNMTFERAYELFKQQAEAVKANGLADLVFLETFSDLLELKAAYLAFSETLDLPVLCSMSFEEDGRTFTGCSAEAFARTAEALGAAAVGVNCGMGPDKMFEVVKKLKMSTTLPVICQPNAGIPRLENGQTIYDMDEDEFSDIMANLAATGADILGGCCGTDAGHIRKTISKAKDIPVKMTKIVPPAVCSASKVTELKPTLVIGERINPTGKPLLKRALVEKDYEYVLTVALEQVNAGADILDINVGMAGIDEEETLPAVLKQVQGVAGAPLQIDSTRAEAVERAARMTAGVPIINSVNAEEKSLSAILPIARKYGCALICLPLDESGIPSTADGRMALVEKIRIRAEKEGIPKERLIVDGLVMAVSAGGGNAIVTLETVKKAKDAGYMTCMGLSNVSFGLPAREVLNGAFFKMAKDIGVTAAIIHPATEAMSEKLADDALLGKDLNFEKYIGRYAGYATKSSETTKVEGLKQAVVKGLKKEAVLIAEKIVTKENYLDVIENEVVAALSEVGEMYEKKIAFLPQLIAASEASKAVLDDIKAKFMQNQTESGRKVLLLTVKGDVHDIGKNIVKSILANYGYKVIDLGKNIGTEEVLSAVEKEHPDVVGMSALMTTTLDAMTETANAVKAKYPDVTVIVGGAVVTADYAAKLGVLYAADAQDAVKKLGERFEKGK